MFKLTCKTFQCSEWYSYAKYSNICSVSLMGLPLGELGKLGWDVRRAAVWIWFHLKGHCALAKNPSQTFPEEITWDNRSKARILLFPQKTERDFRLPVSSAEATQEKHRFGGQMSMRTNKQPLNSEAVWSSINSLPTVDLWFPSC